ncbi:MAG: NADH-quinone oxidoreductase subunit B family protein [Vulcanimicrobiaceae bacterium]
MSNWILYGLRRGILTTRYPQRSGAMPAGYRGAVTALNVPLEEQRAGIAACLSGALQEGSPAARVDALRCYQCGECVRRAPTAFAISPAFEVARLRRRAASFGRSVHVRHVDAGSDGSEEQELQAIFNPFYDANRLGIFLTATPRHADVLIVTGVVTHPMVDPLRRAYDAMPHPKSVIALGTSACSGGIFADSPDVAGPVDRIVPVDVYIPGMPPTPLSILHGLAVALGRAVPAGGAMP